MEIIIVLSFYFIIYIYIYITIVDICLIWIWWKWVVFILGNFCCFLYRILCPHLLRLDSRPIRSLMKIFLKAPNMELRTPVTTRESKSMCPMSLFINLYACEIWKRYIILLGRLPKRECVFLIKKINFMGIIIVLRIFFFLIKQLLIFFWFEFDWNELCLFWKKIVVFPFFIFILLFCFDGFVSLSIYLVVTCSPVSPHKKTKNHLRERERERWLF